MRPLNDNTVMHTSFGRVLLNDDIIGYFLSIEGTEPEQTILREMGINDINAKSSKNEQQQ